MKEKQEDKDLYDGEREKILRRLRKNDIGGWECARRLSALMDRRLATLAKDFLKDHGEIALVAIGGYGRRELCPFSDIDLLFLTEKRTSKATRENVERLLYSLWDSRIRVGHAVRTVEDCIEMANADMTVLTSLLDARLLGGNPALFAEMEKALRKEIGRKRARRHYVDAKLDERDARHKRLGDSRYMLEPNIKDGKGGLRDYQTLFWITDVLYNARAPDNLAELELMSRREARQFTKAHDYLLTVRCQLHDLAGRAEERLHFDIQPALAQRLGYAERDHAKSVERFMKHYFLVTRDIGTLTRIVCAAIEATEEKGKEKSDSFMGLRIVNGRLDFPPWQDLSQNPVEMVRLFRVAQETGYDIHPFALREITRHLPAIGRNFQEDPMANQLFMEILTGRKDAAIMLRRMNDAGILGRFIPAFGKVIALMQFDRYHVFTVDEHTLNAIRIMHELENGARKDIAPLASRLIHDIPSRRALYVAIMLHDICKGRGGNHSQLGAELALKLCPRLGLTDRETRLVSWAVFDHLIMSNTAFRRDLEDPKTISDFMFRVYDRERLDFLTVLTTADIMAVSPECWTGWKAKLLEDLYKKADAALKGQPAVSGEMLSIPADYMAGQTRVDIDEGDVQNTTNVTIYTPDRTGLFALLAGGLSAAGINIIAARIETLKDGTAADSFVVQNLSGHALGKSWQLDELRKFILCALDGTLDVPAAIARHIKKPARKDEIFDIPSKIRINNKASASDTVVEISTRDRHGLLYELTCVLRGEGLGIRTAKITTQGLKAIDVFYVQTEDGQKIGEKQADALRAALKSVMDRKP